MLQMLVVLLSSLVLSAKAWGNFTEGLPQDCEEVYNWEKYDDETAAVPSGVYTIYPAGPDKPVQVYCDMGCADSGSHDEGKWTVIQRRIDGNVSFHRPWEHYKQGFGDPNGEYWLGLENIFLMTYSEKYQLKVEMEDFEKGSAYAQYTLFNVGPESDKYKLTASGFINGGAGNALYYANGRVFTTYDKYSSGCADKTNSGFWFRYIYSTSSCNYVNPNGLYSHTKYVSSYKGVKWSTYTGYYYYSLRSTTMKIRRLSLKELLAL